MKNKFQKASITSAQARAPAFAFQCELQPPLFMMLYTSKPRPASLYLTLALSPLIPIVTTSPGSILPSACVCVQTEKRQRPAGWFWRQRLTGDNIQEVQQQTLTKPSLINATDRTLLLFRTFTLEFYLRVGAAIVAAVTSASSPRQKRSLFGAHLSVFLSVSAPDVLS